MFRTFQEFVVTDLAAAPIGSTPSPFPSPAALAVRPARPVGRSISGGVVGAFADAMASAEAAGTATAGTATAAAATATSAGSRRERYVDAAHENVHVITDLLARERANAGDHAYVDQLEAIRNEYKERLARNRMFIRGEDPGPAVVHAAAGASSRAGAGSVGASTESPAGAPVNTVTASDTVAPTDDTGDDSGWVEEIENSMPDYVPGEMPAEATTTATINGVAPYADPNFGLGRVTTMSVEEASVARTKGIVWEKGQLDEKGKPLWITPDQLKTYWNNVVDMLTTGGLQPYQVFPEATRGNTAFNMDSKRYLEFLGFWDGSSLWTTRDVNSMPIDEVLSRYQGALAGTVPYTGVNTGWGMDNPSTVAEVQSTIEYLSQLKAKGLTNLGLQPGLI
jgi:hypothetical protein